MTNTKVTTPRVSICIANFNGVDILPACLESIRNQVDAPSFEIIVHDDASSDDSLALLRCETDVQLIESEQNLGFCLANNRMAEAARGEYLLLLNNDAALWPDALVALHDAASRTSRAVILSLPQYEYDSGDLLDRGMLLDPFYNPVPNLDPRREEVAMVMGACLWIPRILWNEIGGFPEWMGSIGEDMYLCCMARRLGHPVRVLPISGYRHRVGQSFGGGKVAGERLSTTIRRRSLSERNKTSVLAAMTPTTSLWLLLPLHLLILAMEGLLLTALYRRKNLWFEIYWPAVRSPIRYRAQLLAVRKRLAREGRKAGYFSPFTPMPRKLSMLRRYGLPSIRP